MSKARRLPLPLLVLVVCGSGCEDLSTFSTSDDEVYAGNILDSEVVRKGFTAGTHMEMTFDVDEVDCTAALHEAAECDWPGTLTTIPRSGEQGLFDEAVLMPVASMKHDQLSGFDFPTGRLKNYMFWAPVGREYEGSMALVVVSLLADGDVEVRIVLGPETLYGVFALEKQSP